jgi:ankyrin repeat protein
MKKGKAQQLIHPAMTLGKMMQTLPGMQQFPSQVLEEPLLRKLGYRIKPAFQRIMARSVLEFKINPDSKQAGKKLDRALSCVEVIGDDQLLFVVSDRLISIVRDIDDKKKRAAAAELIAEKLIAVAQKADDEIKDNLAASISLLLPNLPVEIRIKTADKLRELEAQVRGLIPPSQFLERGNDDVEECLSDLKDLDADRLKEEVEQLFAQQKDREVVLLAKKKPKTAEGRVATPIEEESADETFAENWETNREPDLSEEEEDDISGRTTIPDKQAQRATSIEFIEVDDEGIEESDGESAELLEASYLPDSIDESIEPAGPPSLDISPSTTLDLDEEDVVILGDVEETEGESPAKALYKLSLELIEAAKAGEDKKLKGLIKQGADLNTINENGEFALMCAAKAGYVGIASILLKKGAYIDMQDNDGYTALMRASMIGQEKMVKLLLKKRANPDIRNNDGVTAHDLALWNGKAEIAEILGRKMAPKQGPSFNLPEGIMPFEGELEEERLTDSVILALAIEAGEEKVDPEQNGCEQIEILNKGEGDPEEVTALFRMNERATIRSEDGVEIALDMVGKTLPGGEQVLMAYGNVENIPEDIQRMFPDGNTTRWALDPEKDYPEEIPPIGEMVILGTRKLIFDRKINGSKPISSIHRKVTLSKQNREIVGVEEIGSSNSDHSIMEMLLDEILPRDKD